MKATGIVRRIDDLGRVVIPKEIRRTMRLRDGDPLEIYTDKQGEVILKKYSPIGDLSECATEFADSASDILGNIAVITDTDHVIAVSGSMRKELKDKKISSRIDDIIQEKNSIMVTDKSEAFFIVDNDRYADEYESQIVVPIVSQGDTIGSVIFLSCMAGHIMGEAELKAAEVGAAFLAKQMEN